MRKRTPKQMLLAYLVGLGMAWFILQGVAWMIFQQFGLAGHIIYILWLGGSVIILFAKDIADIISAKFRKRLILEHPLLEHCPYSALVAYISPVMWVSLIATTNAVLGFCKDIAMLR